MEPKNTVKLHTPVGTVDKVIGTDHKIQVVGHMAFFKAGNMTDQFVVIIYLITGQDHTALFNFHKAQISGTLNRCAGLGSLLVCGAQLMNLVFADTAGGKGDQRQTAIIRLSLENGHKVGGHIQFAVVRLLFDHILYDFT